VKPEVFDSCGHADDWRNVVNRLKGYGTAPDKLLFVPQGPRDGNVPRLCAFDQVRAAITIRLASLTSRPTPHRKF